MLGFRRKKKQKSLAKEAVVEALKTVYDPEIPVNIYDLGLIYDVCVSESNTVHIKMTLTSPGCPVAQTFPQTVEDTVKTQTAAEEVSVELVWDPPWDQNQMSEAAKLQLGLI